MILPKGELVEVKRGINPKNIFKINLTGYIQFSWRDDKDLYLCSILVRRGNPVLASVEFVKSKKEVKGKKALELINAVQNATVEIYKLTDDKIELAIKMNKDAILSNNEGMTKSTTSSSKTQKINSISQQESTPVIAGIEVNLSEFISTVKLFTGIIKAKGENKEAILVVKRGKIVGAKVIDGSKVFFGSSALSKINFNGKIYAYKEDIDNFIRNNPNVVVEEVKYKTENGSKDYKSSTKGETLTSKKEKEGTGLTNYSDSSSKSEDSSREAIMRKYKIKDPSEEEIEKIIEDVFGDTKSTPFKFKIKK